jgi:hypothetical protein
LSIGNELALTIGQVVSLIAGQTLTVVVPSSAQISNRYTDSLSIEHPPKGALCADRSLPHFAAKVRNNSVHGSLNASSVVEVVTGVASKAETILIVPSLALCVNELTNSVGIEVGSEGAFGTLTVGEVFAVGVVGVGSWGSRRVGISFASSIVEDITVVARCAGASISIPLSTLVTDRHTNIVSVAVVFGRASNTVVVLPFCTSDQSRVGGSTSSAGSVGIDVISSIAILTDTLSPVEDGTVLVNFATDTVVVEDVTG